MKHSNIIKNICLAIMLTIFLAGIPVGGNAADAAQFVFTPGAEPAREETAQSESERELEQMVMSYARAIALIYNFHYRELSDDRIRQIVRKQAKALREIVSSLDRYSAYHDAGEAAEIRNLGGFFGVGIELGPVDYENKAERYKNALKNAAPFLRDEDFRNPESAEAIGAIARLLSAKDNAFARLYREITEGIIPGEGLEIRKVMPGAPAAAAGMNAYLNWRVVRVDGREIGGLTVKETIGLIKGPADTAVILGLKSPDGTRSAEIGITRGRVNTCSLESRMITPGVGYVKLGNFDMTDARGHMSIDPLLRALDDLKRRGMGKLILDLRGNPGGFLHQAHEMLSLFLPAGTLETYTAHRGQRRQEFRSSAFGQKYLYLPLVILVNEQSASASELVAVSLKEHGRATIAGRKTFGKGTVQTLIDLPDGGMLRLTVEKYFSPVNGVCIDEIGVTPDIEIKDDPATEVDEVIEKAIDILTQR